MAVSVQFLGGAGTVTGSKYLIRSSGSTILVDCGLFQGLKELRLKNRDRFPIPPAEIDAVLLTHAHLDHSGYLPLLVREGFKGPIYSTAPTRDLAQIILNDSARIQELDAEYANRKGFTKHKPALPLYTVQDAQAAIQRFELIPTGKWQSLKGSVKDSVFRFSPSGHILGSSFIELTLEQKTLVFSGDLGPQKPLLLRPPVALEKADYLFIESTYGDKAHDQVPTQERLGEIIRDTVSAQGHLIIASFAVGRAQDVLYLIEKLKSDRKIPDLPVYLDSPMAEDATEIFSRYSHWHVLTPSEVQKFNHTARLVRSTEESKNLLHLKKSSIVISSSGMLTGGRVLFHLEHRLADPKNTILLVGFQAAGTRGRHLKEGATELKIHGRYIPVKAKVRELATLSAHADQREILLWLKNFKTPPQMTFIVHGEPHASDALRVRIQDTLGWHCQIPEYLRTIELFN